MIKKKKKRKKEKRFKYFKRCSIKEYYDKKKFNTFHLMCLTIFV